MNTEIGNITLKPEDHEGAFTSSETINGSDGWIDSEGKFYRCQPDEHDTSAAYLVKTKLPEKYNAQQEALMDLNSEADVSNRKILFDSGYIQLSSGQPIVESLPTNPQLDALDKAGIKIPLKMEVTSEIQTAFNRLFEQIKTDSLADGEKSMVKEFIKNIFWYHIDDETEKAERLFDIVTEGFNRKGKRVTRQGFMQDTYEFRYPKEGSVAVELHHHKHDGLSGMRWSSWVRLVEKEEMDKILQMSENSNDDYLEYVEGGLE